MLADLLKVSVRTVRRWNRAGLLPAASEIMQIPHFDFASLTTAKQLAGWMRQGVTVSSMQLQIEALRKRIGSDAALDELPIQADGQQLIIQESTTKRMPQSWESPHDRTEMASTSQAADDANSQEKDLQGFM